jgi:hypothetical protein
MERKETDVSSFFDGFEKQAAKLPFGRMRLGKQISIPSKATVQQPGVVDKVQSWINKPSTKIKAAAGAPLVAVGAGGYGLYKGVDSAIGDPNAPRYDM